MNRIVTCLILSLITTSPALSGKITKGHALANLTFESISGSEKGYLLQGDMEAGRENIFVSMDADENGTVELPEFLGWGYGFENIAQDANKLLAYRTALKVVFSFWDRNSDGKLTQTEHRKAVISDFNRADLNGDAKLEKDEFVSGFSVLVAIRAALKPE